MSIMHSGYSFCPLFSPSHLHQSTHTSYKPLFHIHGFLSHVVSTELNQRVCVTTGQELFTGIWRAHIGDSDDSSS